ncbi:MAG TPA: FtsX-like permease family protein [Actinomycetales bacterium]|jgi:putative ABC transport system permease protein
MGRLSSWRPALRVARRDVLRSRGRSALVVTMVGLPVALVTALATVYTTNEVSTLESLPMRLGQTQAELRVEFSRPLVQDPTGSDVRPLDMSGTGPGGDQRLDAAALQRLTGGTVLDVLSTGSTVRTDRGRLRADVLLADPADPRLEGILQVADGRLPRTDSEVLVTRQLARSRSPIGSTIRLDDGALPVTVVGTIAVPMNLSADLVVARPGLGLPLDQNTLHRYLLDRDQPVLWPEVQKLNAAGVSVISRAVVQSPPKDWRATLPPGQDMHQQPADAAGRAVLVLIVFSIVLEVVLLAGPAFAVGARRQARQLALVAATGGTRRDVRRVVLAQAVVLGAGAAVIGTALGIAGAAVIAQVIPRVSTSQLGPFEIAWAYVAAACALGAVASVGAALLPAVAASRADVVAVLAGRRVAAITRGGWPLLGALLVAAGTALALTLGTRTGGELFVAAGTLSMVVGAIVAMPWIVTRVGRLGAVLPLPLRLAARDSARQRSRTAPAVAAVMAAVAGVTALTIGTSSEFEQARREYQPASPDGVTTVSSYDADATTWQSLDQAVAGAVADRRLLPTGQIGEAMSTTGSPVVYVRRDGCPPQPKRDAVSDADLRCLNWVQDAPAPNGYYGTTGGLVASVEALRALGYPLDAEQEKVLAAGGVLLPAAGLVRGGAAEITTYLDDGSAYTDVRVVRRPAGYLEPLSLRGNRTVHAVVTTPAGAEALGRGWSRTGGVLAASTTPLSTQTEERLEETLAGITDSAAIYTERGFVQTIGLTLGGLAGVAVLVVLVGTLTATGLALADSRPDLATLAAIGARPRTRRVMAAAQALVIGLLGAVSGVLIGLVPGIAVTYPLTTSRLDPVTGIFSDGPPTIDIPWLLLLAVAVVVPALAATTAGVAVRSKLPLTRRLGQ